MRPLQARVVSLLLAVGIATSILAVGGAASAAPGCASADAAGGDWPSLGGNLTSSRNQTAETTINMLNVQGLAPAWSFSGNDVGGTGSFESTPVIANGCVYLTTASGFAYALNADTGQLVWGKQYEETVTGVCCGGTMFAPAVHDGVVYINVSHNPDTATDRQGPYVLALDANTGDVIWKSEPVAAETGAFTNSSSVYFDGMVWIGVCNPEGTYWATPGPGSTDTAGGFVLLDARTGAVVKRTYTIPADEMAKGFGGGSIWSTMAVDPDTSFGYVGSGQPSTSDKESERTNAILKVDLARARDGAGNPVESTEITNPHFGDIVDAYKGNWDDPPYVDVDMSASPTLYHDANGEQMVADLQKSGWEHAAHTRDMERAWAEPISPFGTALGNYSSPATDGANIYDLGTYPGQLWSLNGTTGTPNWVMPVPTGVGANPVTLANGLVYYADGKGVLNVFDAATGAPVLARPMQADVGACTNAGGGVAIARNTVYVVCGDGGAANPIGTNTGQTGWVIAYRLSQP